MKFLKFTLMLLCLNVAIIVYTSVLGGVGAIQPSFDIRTLGTVSAILGGVVVGLGGLASAITGSTAPLLYSTLSFMVFTFVTWSLNSSTALLNMGLVIDDGVGPVTLIIGIFLAFVTFFSIIGILQLVTGGWKQNE